jgi:hypothetical protein
MVHIKGDWIYAIHHGEICPIAVMRLLAQSIASRSALVRSPKA